MYNLMVCLSGFLFLLIASSNGLGLGVDFQHDNHRERRSFSGSDGACSSTPCQMPTSLITKDQAQAILDFHNNLRRSVNPVAMRKMYYNETLASRAQALANKCKIAHEETCLCNGVSVGQNLYVNMATSKYETPAKGVVEYVQNWFNEIADFDITNNVCKAGKTCGHFTQVTWKDSHQVGCGVNRCKRDDSSYPFWEVFVCDYFPSGNFVGERPYKPNSAATCSECNTLNYSPTYLFRCDNKICDICEPGSTGCTSTCNDSEGCDYFTMDDGCNSGPFADIAQFNCPKTCGTCK